MESGVKRQARRTIGLVGVAALMGVLAPAAPRAQSVGDYRLPGATEASPPNPNVQGPVDPDVPVVRGPAPRPSASAPPSPASTPPSTSPTPPPSPQASRTTAPAAQRPAPARTQPGALVTGQPAGAAPAMPPPPAEPVPEPGAGPAAVAALPPLTPAPAAESPAADWRSYWPFAAGALALILTAIAILVWRRRRPKDSAPVFEAPVVNNPAPQPKPQSEAPPAPPAPQARPQGITIELEARRMSASLMATTLSYSLRLTNHTGQPLNALAIEADMVSAHASLAPDKQIASPAERLELRHALVSLAAGETALFGGELRLPLAAITPIRAGDAAYFVPLARLRVEASSEVGFLLVEAQTFVIGELAERPGAPLRPFRLDLGPRNYDKIGQRAVN